MKTHVKKRPKKKLKTKPYRRTSILIALSRIFFLFLFIVFTLNGKLQLWFGIFFLSLLGALFLGRFYCGWICPMNTLFRPISWLYTRLHLHRFSTPGFLQHPLPKYLFLFVFIAAAVFLKISGRQLPILLFLTLFAVVLTLFFEEKMWHSRLCPFGSILDISSNPARHGLRVDPQKCTGCGICEKVCPTEAIFQVPQEKRKLPSRQIRNNTCLTCFRCASACPVKAISYSAVKS